MAATAQQTALLRAAFVPIHMTGLQKSPGQLRRRVRAAGMQRGSWLVECLADAASARPM
jgi:hypothetical protein